MGSRPLRGSFVSLLKTSGKDFIWPGSLLCDSLAGWSFFTLLKHLLILEVKSPAPSSKDFNNDNDDIGLVITSRDWNAFFPPSSLLRASRALCLFKNDVGRTQGKVQSLIVQLYEISQTDSVRATGTQIKTLIVTEDADALMGHLLVTLSPAPPSRRVRIILISNHKLVLSVFTSHIFILSITPKRNKANFLDIA